MVCKYMMKIERGKYYYYGYVKRRFKCIKVGTSKDKSQSDFVDYKRNGVYQFYHEDMHKTRYKSI